MKFHRKIMRCCLPPCRFDTDGSGHIDHRELKVRGAGNAWTSLRRAFLFGARLPWKKNLEAMTTSDFSRSPLGHPFTSLKKCFTWVAYTLILIHIIKTQCTGGVHHPFSPFLCFPRVAGVARVLQQRKAEEIQIKLLPQVAMKALGMQAKADDIARIMSEVRDRVECLGPRIRLGLDPLFYSGVLGSSSAAPC